MNNIELYINGILCDTPREFTVRLNRQLLKPGELNTKDAQFSYSITLPQTHNNNAVFGYANVEETRNKFNREYAAKLYVNGLLIFSGLFLLTGINDAYRGNLYIPGQKSTGDIFGELKLNDIKGFILPIDGGIIASIDRYNTQARYGPQTAIFPLALYGLLPKVPDNNGNYSDRDVWDDTVRLAFNDIPPSINPVILIKHIFTSKGYTITGTALDDPRIAGLYMSYKKASNGEQVWDYRGLDLANFLPDDKISDFLDNFCKAFNLRLSQTAPAAFKLDIKQERRLLVSNQFLEIDGITSLSRRNNSPLGLPSLYKLGFTVNEDEEGYTLTGDDGGGEYRTGAIEQKTLEQKSNFSYNWFKEITKREGSWATNLFLPVISKHEVWTDEMEYPDARLRRYTDLAARFWYYDGLLSDLGITTKIYLREEEEAEVFMAKVSNELPGLSVLNYKNTQYSILDNYFTLLIDADSHFTEVEGFLTPDQYEALKGNMWVMYNRDLYYIAELQGYDPAGRNKTKIKLIRKI